MQLLQLGLREGRLFFFRFVSLQLQEIQGHLYQQTGEVPDG